MSEGECVVCSGVTLVTEGCRVEERRPPHLQAAVDGLRNVSLPPL